jgi:serine/threonine protein kinase/tetratricopeptide (TPR) repeat protein
VASILPALGTLVAERYELRQRLGSGGQSDVYLAFDRELAREVALKLLRPTSETRAYLLKQEFATIATLDHPHIVQAFELGTWGLPSGDRLAYYTMELARGVDFVTAIKDRDARTISSLLAQALSALAHIHSNELLHLDIKPENLLVTVSDSPWLTLVDFGLARRMSGDASGFARGTLAYMAPEMLAGGPVDVRADLYSLGRMLFEGLTGETFEPDAVLPLLEHRRPDLPPALCHLIDRLAATESDKRPPRAHAALAELSGFEPRLEEPESETGTGTMLVAPLIGRQQELNDARKLIRESREKHRLNVIIVSAPKGHGKSRFLTTLQGLCRRDEVRAELDARLVADDRLRPAGDTLEAIEDNARTLAEHLVQWPVWLIDDADALSDVSVEVLGRLFERVSHISATIVIAMTTASATPRWQILEIENQSRLHFIELAPLPRRDMQALTHALLGNGLPEPWLIALHNASAGNPLWAQETLRAWVSEGVLRFHHGTFEPTEGKPPELDRTRLSELMQARLASIEEDLWPAVFAAAILGRELTPERVTRLCAPWIKKNDNPAGKIVAMAMGAMLRHHLIEERVVEERVTAQRREEERLTGERREEPSVLGSHYRFVHEEIMAALRELVAEPMRRRLHSQAATLFKTKKEADIQDFHRVRGTDVMVAARAALESGNRARAVFAYRRAMRRFRRGFNRIEQTDRVVSATLAMAIAECAAQVDEQSESLAWYQRALELSPESSSMQAACDLGIADVLRRRCDYKDAMTHAERALTAVEPDGPEQASVLRLIARLEQHTGEYDAAFEHYRAALKTYGASSDEAGKTRVELDLANLWRERGAMVEAEAHANVALSLAVAHADDGLRARAYQQLGQILCLKGESMLAFEHLSEARSLAHSLGDRRTEGAAIRDIGTLRRQQGRLLEAKDLLEKASRLFFVTGARNMHSDCLYQLGVIETRSGDYTGALSALNEALAIRRDVKDVMGRSYTHIALARLHVELGLYREALHYGELSLREARKTHDAVLLLLAEERIMAAKVESTNRRPTLLMELGRRARKLQIARVEVSILCRIVEHASTHPHEEPVMLEEAVARLLALGTEADNHDARLHAAWGQALLARFARNLELATADFTRALALADGAGQSELAAWLKSDLADNLAHTGKSSQAASLLTQAMMTLREHHSALGAKKNSGYLLVPWRRLVRERFRNQVE